MKENGARKETGELVGLHLTWGPRNIRNDLLTKSVTPNSLSHPVKDRDSTRRLHGSCRPLLGLSSPQEGRGRLLNSERKAAGCWWDRRRREAVPLSLETWPFGFSQTKPWLGNLRETCQLYSLHLSVSTTFERGAYLLNLQKWEQREKLTFLIIIMCRLCPNVLPNLFCSNYKKQGLSLNRREDIIVGFTI